jgi:signal transduction histidine kinase
MDANLSVFKKGLLLVSIPFLSQVLLLAVLATTRTDQTNAQHWAIHTKDVIAQTETAYRLVLEAQLAVRDYILAGSDKAVADFQKIRAQLSGNLGTLTRLVEDNPDQYPRAQQITQKATQLLDWFGETIALHQGGQQSLAAARLRSADAIEATEEIRKLTRQLLDEEERLDRQRRDYLETATLHQNLVLVGGIVLALVSTGLLVWTFSRGIGQRLGVLTENLRRFGAGQEMAPPLAGRDEISMLDRAFHSMAETLAQKDQENEMFVYSVSHDLRTPLVNLQGFSQELMTICKELREILTNNPLAEPAQARALLLLDRDAREAVQFIQTAVFRLSAIIDALLRLSRVGRVEYHKQTVDVAATVRRVIESLHETIARRGVTVTLRPLAPVWADPLAVDQIFANLIANAVYYLDPQRKGTIEVGSAEEPLQEAPRGTEVYYVKDNGLGIPTEFQQKIFLAFQRLHPQAAPGEGIGLALVRRVVERHGGKIWLTSTVGAGTTFFVALPKETA